MHILSNIYCKIKYKLSVFVRNSQLKELALSKLAWHRTVTMSLWIFFDVSISIRLGDSSVMRVIGFLFKKTSLRERENKIENKVKCFIIKFLSLMFAVISAQQNYRIDLDTIWRFVYIACITNDSLHQFNGSISWCLSHRYWCIRFPCWRYRRFGRWGFRLCNGLWWFHILNEGNGVSW